MMLMETRPDVERSGFRSAHPLPQPPASPALLGERRFSGGAEALFRQQQGSGVQPRLEQLDTVHASAIAVETAESEACAPGRPFDAGLGAVEVATGLGMDPHASFTGLFRAPQPGAARALLQQLTVALRSCSANRVGSDSLLATAISRCHAQLASCNGLVGCLVLISGESLSYWSTGNASLALGELQDGEVVAVNVNDSASRKSSSLSARERLKSLGQVVQQARSAFGSIIPIDRAAVLLGGHAPPPPPASLALQPAHRFLVMGAALGGEAFEAAEAVAIVHRSRRQRAGTGAAAARLAIEGHARLAAAGKTDAHVSVAICHLQAEAVEPPASSSGHTGEDELASAGSAQLSPARRVHFLEPLSGSEVALGSSPAAAPPAWSPFHAEAAAAGNVAPEPAMSGEGHVPDSSGLISSNSLLSQPEMCIPEEGALPGEHTALQLPPPLLAPIRKAVLAPAHGDLQNIPPAAVKAKIGRAASMNSPQGLFPLPPPPLSPTQQLAAPLPPLGPRLVSQGSLASLASLARTGSGASQGRRASEEEGRVRGGVPRAVSVPSAMAAMLQLEASPESPEGGPLAGSLFRDSAQLQARARRRGLAKIHSAPISRPASEERLLPAASRQPPATPEGRKIHGQCSALRMLQAAAEPGDGGALGPMSAPAMLAQALGSLSSGESHLEDLQACSSATSSCAVSEADAPRATAMELKPPLAGAGLAFAPRELDSAGRGGLLPSSAARVNALADSAGSLTLPGSGSSRGGR